VSKIISLEVDSTYQYTSVIKLASHMSATWKNPLGLATRPRIAYAAALHASKPNHFIKL